MSNSNTSSNDISVTNEEIKEILNDENAENITETIAPIKKKNIFCRFLALILAIAPIVCLCILPIKVLVNTTKGLAVYEDSTFLTAFLALFKADGLKEFYAEIASAPADFSSFKVFGLNFLAGDSISSLFNGAFLYLIAVAWVLTFIFMIVALFSGKNAPKLVRAIAFVNLLVYAGYALSLLYVTSYLNGTKTTSDNIMVILACVFFLVYLITAFSKVGKKTWLNLLLFILSAAFAGAIAYGLIACKDTLQALFNNNESSIINSVTKGKFFKYGLAGVAGLSLFALFISAIRLTTKKGLTFDLIRHIFHLVVAGILYFFAFKENALEKMQTYTLIALCVAFVQIIVVIISLSVLSKKKKKALETETADETAEDIPEETVTEEKVEEKTTSEENVKETTENITAEEDDDSEESGVIAEAVRLDNSTKTENILEAEEITENQQQTASPFVFTTQTQQTEEEETKTNGYDFYNSKSFDPFIASLSNKEREEFTDLFILKCQGETKNLPDYQVGGDNTDFFRKVFIYLGQYRDKIPDSLLNKMYKFSIKK